MTVKELKEELNEIKNMLQFIMENTFVETPTLVEHTSELGFVTFNGVKEHSLLNIKHSLAELYKQEQNTNEK